MSIARSGLVVFSERSRGCVLRCASHLPLATFRPRLRRFQCSSSACCHLCGLSAVEAT